MYIVYFNGELILEKEACIPIHDPGFQYGEGFFTTIRVTDGVPEYFDLHEKRLGRTLPDPTPLIQANQATQGIWKLKIIITPITFLMTLHPYTLPKEEVKLISYPHPIEHPLAQYKTLSYFERILIRRFAKEAYDAVTYSKEGYILETGMANLFWIHEGKRYTPDRSLPLLYGVMLSQQENLIEVKTKKIPDGAELYICNSMIHVLRVKSLDGVDLF